MFREQDETNEEWIKREIPCAVKAAGIQTLEEIQIEIAAIEDKGDGQIRVTGYWIESAAYAERGMFSGWLWTNRQSGPDDCLIHIYTQA